MERKKTLKFKIIHSGTPLVNITNLEELTSMYVSLQYNVIMF